jgi:hypothetical protein
LALIVLVLAASVGCILAPWPSHLTLSSWGRLGSFLFAAACAAACTVSWFTGVMWKRWPLRGCRCSTLMVLVIPGPIVTSSEE